MLAIYKTNLFPLCHPNAKWKKKNVWHLSLSFYPFSVSRFSVWLSPIFFLSLSLEITTRHQVSVSLKKNLKKPKNKKKSSFWLLLLLSVLKFYLSLFYLCLSLFFIFPPSWIVDSFFFKTKNKIHLPICCPFFQKKKKKKKKTKQNKRKK